MCMLLAFMLSLPYLFFPSPPASSSPPHPGFHHPEVDPPLPLLSGCVQGFDEADSPSPPPPHHTQGFDHPEAPALDLDSAARQLQEATAQGIKKWLGKVRE